MSEANSSAETSDNPKTSAGISETDLILNLANPDAVASAPSKHIDPKWQAQYDGLLSFRDYLLDRINQHEAEAEDTPQGMDKESPSQGSDSDMLRDYMHAMTSSEQETLYEVQDALVRIEDGTYGFCQLSGKPISPERLAAVPWTRFSVEAQREVESHNLSPVHAVLGTLPHEETPPDVPVPGSDAGRETSEPPPAGMEKYTSQDKP